MEERVFDCDGKRGLPVEAGRSTKLAARLEAGRGLT